MLEKKIYIYTLNISIVHISMLNDIWDCLGTGMCVLPDDTLGIELMYRDESVGRPLPHTPAAAPTPRYTRDERRARIQRYLQLLRVEEVKFG